MTPTRHRRVLAGILVVIALCAIGACGKKKPSAASPQSTTARIEIVTPKNGDVTGPDVHVKVNLNGGTLVPLTSTKLVANGGHLHLLVDGQVKSMALGTEQDATGLTPGRHLITVEFVNALHQPWKNPVRATVVIQVQ